MNHELERLIVWLLFLGIPALLWVGIPTLRRYVPPVVLQIGTGFALGPEILGRLFPNVFGWLFHNDVIVFVSSIGFSAGIIFVFITGLHIHFGEFPNATKRMIGIVAITSTVVPFSMGVPFAYFLAQHFPGMVGEHGTALTFALAIGVAVSVTALPVLSAILHDMKEQESGWGRFILTIAVAHDAILWINLTALLLLAGAEEGHGGPGPIGAIVFTIGFFVVMVTIVRNGLSKLVSSAWWKHLPDGMKLALQGVYFLAGAIVTQLIGIHYLIGAVVCGAVWPDHNRKPILKRMETFVIALVLPLFFAAAGIRTRFDLGSAEVWVIFFSMTTIAFIGQFLGTSLVLKALGQKWSFALSVGTMLTCKGIAELVVLGLLNAEGIISNEAYAGMVLMALASTASTKFGVMMIRRIFGHHHLPSSHM